MPEVTTTVASPPATGGLRLTGHLKTSSPGHPLISVITVVYNGVRDLSATIQSVSNQRYDNVEYLILDGGSSDGTLDIIRAHDGEIDYWLSEPDGGVYDAMNKAVDHASGNWILFLGAGDLLLNCLHEIAPHLRNSSTVYYGDVYMPSEHRLYDGRFSAHKLSRSNMPHQAIFYPRPLFDDYRYDLRYPILADYVVNIRAYCDKKFRFRYIRTLVTIYEDREGMSSCSRDAAFDTDHYRILRDNFGYLIGCEYRVREFFRVFERNVLRRLTSFLKEKLRRAG
jgi:glycosyltransferase involved in cell wall biosynthesis